MTEQELLRIIGNIADKQKVSVWVVGGFIRDKLLNKSVKDIDFAVVGDGHIPGLSKLLEKKEIEFETIRLSELRDRKPVERGSSTASFRFDIMIWKILKN